MITVLVQGSEFTLKNKISDFTIGEFENISSIFADENVDKIDRYSQLFILLGIPSDTIDDLEISEFFNLVEKYSDNNDLEIDYLAKEKQQEIEINGRIYRAYDETFKMNVKQMRLIENKIKNSSTKYIGDLMAIIFKDVHLSNNEHYVEAHLKHKAKLFRENITADVALPYVGFFSKELLNNIQTYAKL